MLRACMDALMQIAARCGPMQRDPAAAASDAQPAPSPTAQSGELESRSETADQSSNAVTQAAAAAQAEPSDNAIAVPEADADPEVGFAEAAHMDCFLAMNSDRYEAHGKMSVMSLPELSLFVQHTLCVFVAGLLADVWGGQMNCLQQMQLRDCLHMSNRPCQS